MPPRTVHLPASTQRGCRNAGPSARTSRNTYKCSARGAPLCRQAPAARHLVGSASRRPMPINTDEAMARRSGRATPPPASAMAPCSGARPSQHSWLGACKGKAKVLYFHQTTIRASWCGHKFRSAARTNRRNVSRKLETHAPNNRKAGMQCKKSSYFYYGTRS